MANTKKALKREAGVPGDVKVKFGGDTYTVRSDAPEDADFLEAYEKDQLIGATRALVGDFEYARFKANGDNGRRKSAEVGEFFRAVLSALGSDPGESKD